MLKAIFLDFDKTLQDLDAAFDQAVGLILHSAVQELGIETSALVAILHQTWEELWPQFLDGTLPESDLHNQWFLQAMKRAGSVWAEEKVLELVASYQVAFESYLEVFPDVYPALDSMAKHWPEARIAILTNGPTLCQKQRIVDRGIGAYTTEWVISEEIGVAKPNPEFFRHALRALDVLPDEAVMIGDAPFADIAGAQGLNIPTIWLNRKELPWPEGIPASDAIATNLLEVVDILRAWSNLDGRDRDPVGLPAL